MKKPPAGVGGFLKLTNQSTQRRVFALEHVVEQLSMRS